jgi:ABC-2 type transport system permease protein
MRKVFKLAAREYRAAVRTKGFIVGLLLAPLLMGGSGLAMLLLKDQVETTDRRVAIIDRSGVLAQALIQAAEARNEQMVHDPETGKKVRPAYVLFEMPDRPADRDGLHLELSGQVRQGELHAFVDIGGQVVDPEGTGASRDDQVKYFAKNASLDELRQWIGGSLNDRIRRLRLIGAGLEESQAGSIFAWVAVPGFGLLQIDTASGGIQAARQSSEGEAIGVPLILAMLMFLMIMMGAMPLMSTVMEEKSQRIAEVLLGSISPFQFMLGKVIGGVAVSMTAALVYVAVGVLAAERFGVAEFVPYAILPWFFAFMLLAITLFGSTFAALGSACNDAKEAQSLTLPAMIPIMIPMFVLMPVLQHPESTFATVLSLFPPATPMMMMLRMSTPAGIPWWQPVAGLAGMVLFTTLAVWGGGRVFRVGILMQGVPPKLGSILRWAVRG